MREYDPAEITLAGPVGGPGFTGADVLAALLELGPDRDLRIILRSGGGSSLEGHRIAEALRDHGGHVGIRAGWAASAAVDILLAGDHRVLASNGFVGIHHARTSADNATVADLFTTAEQLQRSREQMIRLYEQRTHLRTVAIATLLEGERDFVLAPAAAVQCGFADEIGPAVWPAPPRDRPTALRRDELTDEELSFFVGHEITEPTEATAGEAA